MSYVLNQGLGDVGCIGVDVSKWNNANKVPVFRDAFNTWVVKVKTSESYTGAEIQEEIKRIFADRWFASGYSAMSGSKDVGRAEIQSIRVLNASQPSQILAMYPKPLAAVWSTSGPQLEWRTSGPEVYVEVRFVYRGSMSEMPWPRTVAGYFDASWYCPKETEFGVYTVYEPSYKDVPAEKLCDASGSFFKYSACRDEFWKNLGPKIPGFGLPSWLKVIGYGLAGYAAYRLVRPIVMDAKALAGKKE